MIGYRIELKLENALGHDRAVATLLTQVVVDPRDPGFAKPTKPVGPIFSRAEALAKARDCRYGGMRWPDHILWRFVSELWHLWKKDIHTVRQERGSGFR